MIIRTMEARETAELGEIYLRAFESEAVDEHWTPQSATALVEYWLHRQSDLAFVAELDGALAGGLIIGVKPWWDGNHLVEGELFVDRPHQNKGVGRALIHHVLKVAIEKYAPVLWETYTFRSNDFPLSWYKKLGFREINEWVMIRAEVPTLMRHLE